MAAATVTQQKQCFLKNLNNPRKSILLDKDQINIGRGENMYICLLSVMISKHHATLKRINKEWTITDENSMNGVFVNRKQIHPYKPFRIDEGDIIQIGKSKDPPFSYLFQSRLVTKRKDGKLKPQKSRSPSSSSSCDKLSIPTDNSRVSPNANRNVPLSKKPEPSPCSSSSKPDAKLECLETCPPKRKKPSLKSPVAAGGEEENQEKLLAYEKRLQEMQKRLKASEQALQKEKDKSSKQAFVITALNSEMEGAIKQLEEVEETKYIDKLLLEEELRQKSEIALQEKEGLLWKTLQEKKAALEEEMQSIEVELHMKNVANQEELDNLLKSKRRLEQILANKEVEQKLLEQQLDEAKEVSKKEKESALKIKDDVLSNFAELMETELQCSVCSELFVQATTLNCTHSFCSFCIAEWMKRKKNCPVCRTPVSSQARAIVLDSYIEKMVSCFSEEMKKRREQICTERKAMQSVAPIPEKKLTWDSRRILPHINAEDFMLRNLEDQEAVLYEDLTGLSSDLSEVDSLSDEETDENLVDGMQDSYFGGYGRCYLCGQRGHWANGCPFR